jgi:hypothetical protein
MDLESPLTHSECFGILWHLSVSQDPQVFQPGTPTRQSLVPGYFHLFFGKLPYIAGLNFSCSNPLCFFISRFAGQVN